MSSDCEVIVQAGEDILVSADCAHAGDDIAVEVVSGGAGPAGPAGASGMTAVVGRGAGEYQATGTLGSPTDHTTIQAAINAVQAAGGGTVLIREGTYFLGATINVTAANVAIVGVGRSTELRAVGNYGNVFLCALATTPTAFPGLAGLRFEHIRFETTVDRTTGAAIRANYTHNAVFYDLYIADSTYGHSFNATTPTPKYFHDGIYLDCQDQATVENVVAMCNRRCVHANGSNYASADFSYDGTVTNCKFWGPPRARNSIPSTCVAIYLGPNVGGFVCAFVSTNNHYHAIEAVHTTGQGGGILTIRGGYAENNAGRDYVVTNYETAVIHDLWGTLQFNGDGNLTVIGAPRSDGVEINGFATAIVIGDVAVINTNDNATVTKILPNVISFSDGTVQLTAFSPTYSSKLDGIASNATANATDAQLRDRSTHTGTQAAGTITGLAASATTDTTSATNITSGTLPAARLPATTVTAGAYGSASSVATFTVDAAGRLTAAGSTAISVAASAIVSGTIATARLASGTASSSTFLRGDQTWAPAGSTSASDLTSGTLPEGRLPNLVILHPFLLAAM